MRLIIYTHTDYLDIFQIALDHLKLLDTKNIFIFANTNNPLYEYKTYLYDNSQEYPNRISQCLNQLEDIDPENEYILLCHDNDIVMSFNNNNLDKIKECMKTHNIDRCGLITLCDKNNISNEYYNDNTIVIDGDLNIVKNPSHWAYSVGPSIWNRKRFINLLLKFHYKDYRNIEDKQVQDYVNKNMKIYNVGATNNYIKYIGRKSNYNIMAILHITVRGNFIYDDNSTEKEYVMNLKTKYNNIRETTSYNL
jgi:hypothetical protein